MPRDSSGVYSQPPDTQAVPFQTASSSAFNLLIDDISDALTASMTRDGTGIVTGPINMGDFGFGNLANMPLTLDDLANSTLPSTTDYILIAGIRWDRRGVSMPTHPGRKQSADGAWWEHAHSFVAPEHLGAAGDDVTDDSDAFENALLVAVARDVPFIPHSRYQIARAGTIDVPVAQGKKLCIHGMGTQFGATIAHVDGGIVITPAVANSVIESYNWSVEPGQVGCVKGLHIVGPASSLREAPVTMDIPSSTVTWINHPFVDDDGVRFSTDGSLPTGIVPGTIYYVVVVDADNFTLLDLPSSDSESSPIVMSGSQSGTHTGVQQAASGTSQKWCVRIEGMNFAPMNQNDSSSPARCFTQALAVTGVLRPVIRNNCVRPATATVVGAKADFWLDISDSYGPFIEGNDFAGNAVVGIKKFDEGSTEGFILRGNKIVGADIGLELQDLDPVNAPVFDIVGNHINCRIRNLRIDGWSIGIISENAFYNVGKPYMEYSQSGTTITLSFYTTRLKTENELHRLVDQDRIFLRFTSGTADGSADDNQEYKVDGTPATDHTLTVVRADGVTVGSRTTSGKCTFTYNDEQAADIEILDGQDIEIHSNTYSTALHRQRRHIIFDGAGFGRDGVPSVNATNNQKRVKVHDEFMLVTSDLSPVYIGPDVNKWLVDLTDPLETGSVDYPNNLIEVDRAAQHGRIIRERMSVSTGDEIDVKTKTVTADNTTDRITWSSHPFVAGDPVIFTNSGGALPAGMTANVVYFVLTVVNGNVFTISETPGGTILNLTDDGTGTHTGYRVLGYYLIPKDTFFQAGEALEWEIQGSTVNNGNAKSLDVRLHSAGAVGTSVGSRTFSTGAANDWILRGRITSTGTDTQRAQMTGGLDGSTALAPQVASPTEDDGADLFLSFVPTAVGAGTGDDDIKHKAHKIAHL